MYECKTMTEPSPVRDFNGTIEEIKDLLLREFSAEQQKEILLGVKSKIQKHYSELREEHLKQAEVLGNSFDALNF